MSIGQHADPRKGVKRQKVSIKHKASTTSGKEFI